MGELIAGLGLSEIFLVVIGLLTAIAIPQFMQYRSQARIAQLQSLAGTIRAAAQMSRAVYLAQNGSSSGGTVNVDDNGVAVPVTVNGSGYPIMGAGGIESAIKTLGFPTITYDQATGIFTPDPNVLNCSVTYDPTAGDVLPAGMIVSGC